MSRDPDSDYSKDEEYYDEVVAPRETLQAEADEELAAERAFEDNERIYGFKKGDPAPDYKTEVCYGSSCAVWAAGGDEKCPIGACEKWLRKFRAWQSAQ